MESSNSNSQEIELHQLQLVVIQLHSIYMTWFKQLEIHLSDLYHNNLSYDVDAFKPAFYTFFGEEHQTFKLKMFYNLDQLRQQFERENLHEVNAKNCLEVLRTQFKEFFASQEINSLDHLHQRWQQDFEDYTIVNLKPTNVLYSRTWTYLKI
ncbi:putative retrotransposon protein [Tanacetum coccineum]